MKAVLFDIDGTLVRAGAAGREAIIQAAAQVTGLKLQFVRQVVEAMDFRGCTDSLILEQLAAGLAVVLAPATVLAAYSQVLVASLKVGTVELLPGVHDLLEELAARGIQVGLLTGNVRAGARAKLAPVRLDHLVEQPGGFGDDGHERASIARIAVQRLHHVGVRPGAVVVIGDTEHDVAAARAAGALAVTVQTGWTDLKVLEAAQPNLHLRDLADAKPLLALLDRL